LPSPAPAGEVVERSEDRRGSGERALTLICDTISGRRPPPASKIRPPPPQVRGREMRELAPIYNDLAELFAGFESLVGLLTFPGLVDAVDDRF
jgi:hypothetical protein